MKKDEKRWNWALRVVEMAGKCQRPWLAFVLVQVPIIFIWIVRKEFFLGFPAFQFTAFPHLLDWPLKFQLCCPLAFPHGSDGNESACKAGDLGLIPGWRRSPGEGNGYPLQYFCLEIPWTEEPGRLQSMGSRRVRQDWATNTLNASGGPALLITTLKSPPVSFLPWLQTHFGTLSISQTQTCTFRSMTFF